MKKTLLAIMAIAPATFANAETVTFNASQCHVKYDNAQKIFNKGTIENRLGDYDVLYCDIALQSGKVIDQVNVNVYSSGVKSNSQSSCNVTFYHADANSVVASGKTERAENGRSVLSTQPLATLSDDVRGLLTCTIGGVEEGGLVRFSSYSVSYQD